MRGILLFLLGCFFSKGVNIITENYGKENLAIIPIKNEIYRIRLFKKLFVFLGVL